MGVSSYLLIGFYYKLPTAVSASKKAFIVTRFADLGFLIGILVLSYYTDTFNFVDLVSNPGQVLTQPAAPPSWAHRSSPGPWFSSSSAAWASRP